MKKEDFFEVIGDMDGDIVEQAGESVKKKHFWSARRIASIAAALALVIGVGSWAAGHTRMGNSAPGAASFGGGDGHDDGSTVFMHYAGPVLPMTAIEGGEGLEVSRGLVYDFSPWNKYWWSNEDEANSRTWLSEEKRQEVLEQYNEWYPEGGRWRSSTDLLVTDSYTLANPTGEDRRVALLYPFVSNLRDMHENTPALCADGEELRGTVHAGTFSDGPDGAAGGEDVESFLALAQLDSWEGYRDLLSDGTYLERALREWPDLSGTPATVYKFTAPYGPQPDEEAGYPNPSIRAMFELDYSRTNVLSYGFSGGRWDSEGGTMIQEFSIPRQFGWTAPLWPYYLIAVGDDIQNLTTGGYVTGGTDLDTPTLDGCGVTVERYETDLESALRTAAEQMYGNQNWDDGGEPDFEMYFGLLKDYLCSYGVLAPGGVKRYHTGWLEDTDTVAVDRVFYLEAEVTVPAGGSVSVAASFTKGASYDFCCAHTENLGVCGYDMVTKLGTSLSFTGQTAEAVNTDSVKIVRQNYGFDWENGVSRVTLDPDVEHYYLEVRRAESE